MQPSTGYFVSVCLDDAGVHGKAFALDQTRVHEATEHFIRQPAKQIAGPESDSKRPAILSR